MRAAVMLFAVWSSTAFANIVWRGDFEPKNLSQYDGFVVHAERWTFVNSPAPREGNWAARVELRADDFGPSNLVRTEVTHTPPANTFENSERFYAWSAMGSTTEPLGNFDHQIMFWECTAPIYQQEMSLHVNGTSISFATSPQGGQYQTRWTGQFAFGVWHDFILHVKWSLDPTVGFAELYYDGVLVLPKVFFKTMHANNGTGLVSQWHHGLFLGTQRANKPVEVVFLDAQREATTLADVMAVAVDAGVPDAGAVDSGVPDAGPVDAGVVDAGELPDAGEEDAGISDAGQEADAGLSADAGTGSPDAGQVAPDGGTMSGQDITGGCSCQSGGPTLVLLALGTMIARRRRHCPR